MLADVNSVSVVTVLYNSAAVIESLLTSTPAGIEVVAVDNASQDDGAVRATLTRPEITLLRSDSNLGFGGGCNLGWPHATRPYVAFVNPDVLLQSDTLTILLTRLLQEPHGIVGPALLDGHGDLRPPNRRPSVFMDFANLIPAAGRWAPIAGWDGRLGPGDPRRRHGGPVAYVEGACFMVRKADLEAIGGFDPDLFLYCEEQSLAMRLGALGGRAFYDTATVVRHSGAHATDLVAPFALFHYFRSRMILYRKRDGRVRGGLSGALLVVGALVQLVASLANLGLRRRTANTPTLALATLRGILSGFRARLEFAY